MQAFPPALRDLDHQRRFGPLGLLEPTSPYGEPDPGLAAALRVGLDQGRERLEQALTHTPTPRQNGWQLTYHVFDYNLDFFETGALDDPEWKTKAEPRDRANWLPTPAGDFRPILRMYEPQPALFDGSSTLPPITRRP
jgi:hypothetical protein